MTEHNRGQGTRKLEPSQVDQFLKDTSPTRESYPAPWVIELRVVGTASVIQARVRDEMTIGRFDGRMSIIPDINLEPFNAYQMGVSRRHAVMFSNNNQLMLRDLGSANGTYINDRRLEPLINYRVNHGDTIAVGKLHLQIFYAVMPSSENIIDKTQPIKFEIPSLGSGQSVLVVDDDRDVAFVLASVLEQAGFSVAISTSFADAVSIIDREMPLLIVLELMLPDRSGLDLLEYIRSRQDGAAVPVLVVSSASAGFQMSKAMHMGVDVFLNKPVGIDELLRGISKITDFTRE